MLEQNTIEILLNTKLNTNQLYSELEKLRTAASKPIGINFGSSQNYKNLEKELALHKAINEAQIKHLNTMRQNSELGRGRTTGSSSDIAAYYKDLEQQQTNILKDALRERQRLRNVAALEQQSVFKKFAQAEAAMSFSNTPKVSSGYGSFGGGSSTRATTPSADVSARLGGLGGVIKQHAELDEVIKKVDKTAMNSFPHKVSTTAQYMLAGSGIMGVITALRGMTIAIIESDKAVGMFEGVLGMTTRQAQGLQQEIFKIGTTFGGNLQDLNESALALGRAGLQSSELAGALKVVSQAALVSGDSLDAVTELLVSWKTVHPEESIQHIGDAITKVGNASLASFDDFKTMTNYLLTSTASMGITADSAIALGGAWRNLGKGASTTGTEIRRFMDQISNGSDDVKKAYWTMGVNLDAVNKDLAKGGATAEKALIEVYKNIHDAMLDPAKKEAIAAASAKLQTLDKATLNSNKGLAEGIKLTSGEVITAYEAMAREAKNSTGATEEAANRIALTYEKMWERIKNSLTAGSVDFEKGFQRALAGPDASVGSFKEKIKTFDEAFSGFMITMGTVFGTTALVLSKVIGYVDDLIVGYTIYKSLVIGTAVLEALNGVRLAIMGVLGMQVALNTATKTNPWIALATVLGTAAYAMYEYATYTDDAAIATTNLNKSTSNLQFKVPSAEEQAKLDTYLSSMNKLSVAAPLVDAKKKRPTLYAGSFNEEDDMAFFNKTTVKGANRFGGKILMSSLGENVAAASTPKVGPLTPPGSGPKLDGKDNSGKINKDAMEAYRVAIGNSKVAEETHFVNSNITVELEKQRYHVATTIPKMKASLGLIKDKEIRQIEANKLALDEQDTKNKTQAIEKALLLEANNRISTLGYESSLIGQIKEDERVRIDNARQLVLIERQYQENLAKKMDPEKAKAVRDAELINAKLTTDEKTKQIELASRLRDESITMTSLQIQAANATSGAEQIALEQQMLRTKFDNDKLAIEERYKLLKDEGSTQQLAEIENAKKLMELELRKVEGAESYHDLLTKSNIAFERQNSTAQQFMRITEAGLSALSSGLTSYFTIGDEGFGKWSVLRDTLAQAIMKGLMQELVVNQMIQAVRTGMGGGSGGGLLGGLVTAGMNYFTGGGMEASAAVGAGTYSGGLDSEYLGGHTTGRGFWAKGGVVSDGQPTYLAKGGYVNSIVKKPTYVAKGTIAGESGAELVAPIQRDSQGRMGVLITGREGNSQSVTVNIVNESGEKLAVTKSEANTDMSGLVLDIVIDAIARNKRGMRDIVKG